MHIFVSPEKLSTCTNSFLFKTKAITEKQRKKERKEMDGQIIWTFGLFSWSHKIELDPTKMERARLQGLNSNSFAFNSNGFELGLGKRKVQKCSDFWRNLDKCDKNCGQDLKVKLEVE